MKETPQQYVRRMMEHLGDRDPVVVQGETAARLARLVRGLSPARRRYRPAPGKWSINEIVAHLADSEIVLGYRYRMILSRNGAPIEATDQDAWARTGRYQRSDTRAQLALFRVLRGANLEFIRSLSPRQLRQFGVHSERGRETIAHIVRIYAGHDVNHLRQIEGIRRGSGGQAPIRGARTRA